MWLVWKSTVICSYSMLYCIALCISSISVLLYLSGDTFSVEIDSMRLPLTPTGIPDKITPVTNKITPEAELTTKGDLSKKTTPEPDSESTTKKIISKVTPKSEATQKSTSISKTSLDGSSALAKFLKKRSNYNIRLFYRDVLSKLSNSQKDSIVTAFGVPNFSPNFINQFLICAGRELSRRSVNITSDGNVVMPKHFQKCKSRSFQKNRNTVALLSFPGSGNSWVRQLLETTTGTYTGAYQDCDDSYIISGGMIGEGVYTDNVIAVKIHGAIGGALQWLYQHNIIYIVRNPFDTILAEWKRSLASHKVHLTAHVATSADFGK